MGEYNEVYQRARYYDIAFSRDVTREVDFLSEFFSRHAGRPLRSMLDIACGPGYHARIFAKRGVEAHGLDLRPEMVDFARDEAEAAGVTANWFAADMRSFDLDEPVDLALNSYDSIDCLSTDEELIDHFRTVARNLTPDGLYIFELTHPRDCFLWNYGNHRYAGERNGTKVEIVWVPDGRKVDALNQAIESNIVMRVQEHGETKEFHDHARENMRLPREFASIAKRSGALEVDRFLGDFRFDQPFDDSPGSRRLIVVLRRSR
ncbi:MAG TPA: class I SAM-dependent methyltransferase [Magnetospirillaceae bacterium]